jgi:hypothetical protein
MPREQNEVSIYRYHCQGKGNIVRETVYLRTNLWSELSNLPRTPKEKQDMLATLGHNLIVQDGN